MKDKKIGGLILFSKGMLDNNMKIGSITVLERIILTYQQVGLDPIVVVSDIDLYYMVSNLKKYPIIYLQKEKKNTFLLTSLLMLQHVSFLTAHGSLKVQAIQTGPHMKCRFFTT